MASDWDDDEPIGYKKPPKWTRFERGQSGNPSGRPRKKSAEPASPVTASASDRHLRQVLDRKVSVKDASGSKQISMHEAVVQALALRAAKGDVFAIREITREARELEAREAARQAAELQEAEEEKRATYEYIVALQKTQAEAWAAATIDGREPENPWPHPDDILLVDPANYRWRISGPLNEKGVLVYEYVQAERDANFARAALERRSRKRSAKVLASFCDMIWVSYDVMLPKRWQVSHDPDVAMWFLLVMPIQDLRLQHARYVDRARSLRLLFDFSKYKQDTYRFTNAVMKPLLKRQGYRSLAEFERAWEATGGQPPWPKSPP